MGSAAAPAAAAPGATEAVVEGRKKRVKGAEETPKKRKGDASVTASSSLTSPASGSAVAASGGSSLTDLAAHAANLANSVAVKGEEGSTGDMLPAEARRLMRLPHGAVVCAVACSDPWGLVFTGGKGCVKVWNVLGNEPVQVASLLCLVRFSFGTLENVRCLSIIFIMSFPVLLLALDFRVISSH